MTNPLILSYPINNFLRSEMAKAKSTIDADFPAVTITDAHQDCGEEGVRLAEEMSQRMAVQALTALATGFPSEPGSKKQSCKDGVPKSDATIAVTFLRCSASSLRLFVSMMASLTLSIIGIRKIVEDCLFANIFDLFRDSHCGHQYSSPCWQSAELPPTN